MLLPLGPRPIRHAQSRSVHASKDFLRAFDTGTSVVRVLVDCYAGLVS